MSHDYCDTPGCHEIATVSAPGDEHYCAVHGELSDEEHARRRAARLADDFERVCSDRRCEAPAVSSLNGIAFCAEHMPLTKPYRKVSGGKR